MYLVKKKSALFNSADDAEIWPSNSATWRLNFPDFRRLFWNMNYDVIESWEP